MFIKVLVCSIMLVCTLSLSEAGTLSKEGAQACLTNNAKKSIAKPEITSQLLIMPAIMSRTIDNWDQLEQSERNILEKTADKLIVTMVKKNGRDYKNFIIVVKETQSRSKSDVTVATGTASAGGFFGVSFSVDLYDTCKMSNIEVTFLLWQGTIQKWLRKQGAINGTEW
ncbi:MAG: hypothetical protein ACI92I_000588 [Acidimicrobiales bacterium]|jgi:hypothetical protein